MYVWDPSLVVQKPGEPLRSLNKEIEKGHKELGAGMTLAIVSAGVFGFVFLAGGLSEILGVADPNFYFRAGQGGFSIRVLQGIDWGKLGLGLNVVEVDIGWDEIEDWQLTQHKHFGSLSRNAGNISADFSLKTVDGKKYSFTLDTFREPGHIIHDRIQEAMEMVPAELGGESRQADEAVRPEPVR